MLNEFGPEIWLADGPEIVAALGFHYPTRMAVIRLSSRELFVWSPIALTGALRTEVDALGDVAYLVAPNTLHHVFIGDWKQIFPHARLCAAPGLRVKRRDLAIDAELSNFPVGGWSDEIEHVLVRNAIATEAVFFHRKSGAVLFTDFIQHLPRDWFSGWRALIANWDLMTSAEPAVPRKFRLGFTDKRAARDQITRILAWPAQSVVMAHGAPVTADAQAFLRRAFRWLIK